LSGGEEPMPAEWSGTAEFCGRSGSSRTGALSVGRRVDSERMPAYQHTISFERRDSGTFNPGS
jgi:hypothetical protein